MYMIDVQIVRYVDRAFSGWVECILWSTKIKNRLKYL